MNPSNVISIPNGGTPLTGFQRVKVGSGPSLLPADAADNAIGHVLQDTAAAGLPGRDVGDVMLTSGSCQTAIASEAIAAGAEFESADGGRIAPKNQGAAKGVTLQAAAGAGSQIRVVYY